MNPTRRSTLLGLLALGAAGTGLAACNEETASAPEAGGNGGAPQRRVPSGGQAVDLDALLAEGPLPDIALGDPTAPVVIVEYASLTCGHCRNFHANTLPALKERYIDTGKVYFILREFPLDPLARAASAIARCGSENQYYNLVDVLFETQRDWAGSREPAQALFQIAAQAGFTQESFNACLTNRELETAIVENARRGDSQFGVNSTPTLFINGYVHRGDLSIDELAEIVDPLL